MPLLEVQEVSRRYGTGRTAVGALEEVTFTVDPGQLLAVVGPSGSGKTTLLSIIAALLSPTSGKVLLGGAPTHLRSGWDAAAFRRGRVGLVFQDHHLIPYLSARENLLVVPSLSGRIGSGDRTRADGLLDEFGLLPRAGHTPAALSGGERQRVAVARAFMNEPEIMLVDEPTSSLDTERGGQVLRLLRDQVHRRETTCIMVTHDLRMAEQADRTLRLVDGRLAGE